ncbi:M28 family peptidase [Sphingomonas montana]|uniref:M28 family peptidase n=1 Tax=Sphingomonas montana TaxID=1843236 RepID=UPI00096D4FF1|nr:M28 family peptidase [Sphingomonas montana]
MRTLVLTALLLSAAAGAQPLPSPVQPDAIKEDVRILSSDAFQGRGPGERGETVTLAYLKAQFEAAGLQPGGPNGAWFQDVPLIRMDKAAVAFAVTAGGAPLPTARARDWSLGASHEGVAGVTDAPLVFAGFGISAPELGWDDYAGADVRGKVVLILPNDPDHDQPTGPFGGRQRSRYAGGKAAAAFARGAAAVLTIHREALTSWPWQQVWNSDANATFRPASAPTPTDPARLTGYVTSDLAAQLMARAGLDLEALIRAAQRPGFRPVAIPGAALTASATVTATPMITRNIVARIDGTTRAGETVLFGAHWDAYGIGAADATGDRIRNGAIDNAVGTATLLDVARAFARGPRTKRTLLFVGYTSEEDGLLGAYHYVANPIRPLETTAAVFNLDPHLALSATRSVELIGAGRVDLEDDLARLAQAQGRRIEPEVAPEAGWYQRSDHYAFAQAGVPSLYFRAGRDLADGTRADAAVAQYNAQCYHQRCDEFQEGWDMAAAGQDGALVHALGLQVANGDRWPEWRPGGDFAPIRAKSRAARR